jgi:hypothetical protein
MKIDNFYVYVYLDPRKEGEYNYGNYTFRFEPFYVGKGKDKRCNVHLSSYKKNSNGIFRGKLIHIMEDLKQRPYIFKLIENITEEQAFELEIYLIKLIGRKNLGFGPLSNMTNGGDGFSGSVKTEEERRISSERMKQRWENKDFRECRSKDTKKQWETEEIRRARLESMNSIESKKKLSESLKKHWNNNISHKKLQSENMSNRMKELFKDPEFKKRQLELLNTPESIEKKRKTLRQTCHSIKTWEIINPNGKKTINKNLNLFCENFNLNYQSMLKGNYKGWRCERIED